MNEMKLISFFWDKFVFTFSFIDRADIAKVLIEHDANVNIIDSSFKRTPLHVAAQYSALEGNSRLKVFLYYNNSLKN